VLPRAIGEEQNVTTTTEAPRKRIPRSPEGDYTREAAERRRAFIEEETGVDLEHVSSYSFDPSMLSGNIENFTGVAQVPIAFAGPLLVNGEHARGEFYVPLATAEGTLVAPKSTCCAPGERASWPRPPFRAT
jgi:hydroxymethylglutaryl-CoA reductase